MNGDWFDPFGQIGRWYFVQEGILLSGWLKNAMPNPNCGAIIASGTVKSGIVSFTITPAVANKYCNFTIDAQAYFYPDCQRIEGNWTYKENDKVEKSYFTFFRNMIDIIEPMESQFVIPSPPQMPNIVVTAVIEGGSFKKLKKINIPVYSWSIKIHKPYIPTRIINVESGVLETNEPSYQPNFNSLTVITEQRPHEPYEPPRPLVGGIIGGDLTIFVELYQNVLNGKAITILGTNPGQAAIEQMITDNTIRKIACTESRYRQFDAKREAGVGYPLGKKCGVGIMQLCEPHATLSKLGIGAKILKVE